MAKTKQTKLDNSKRLILRNPNVAKKKKKGSVQKKYFIWLRNKDNPQGMKFFKNITEQYNEQN